ncbi:malate dehydrogenase, mitochondrial-like [Lucilia cuprina]|uniref:malate dehydrogenase, mitochondrial-like n=1 Tax=Lucilia cuprina TaxID=7375 RepID=UPI001F05825A|nr:malate dehydrogenase, mitochondrial-like [Lucilia cuprina]
MLRQLSKVLSGNTNKRFISSTSACFSRITVIGSAGGIGQALAMLIKADRLVSDLVLMDIKNTDGIAADVSHIDTFSGVKAFTGADKLEQSLECSNLVVVAAGVARTDKTTTRAALFDANKDLIYQITALKAKICPEAILAIITNPVNALVPLAAETLKQLNSYDPKKLFGVTKLDTMRARTFIGEHLLVDPAKVKVNVIGGHSSNTIIPLISTATPKVQGDCEELSVIYERIRCAGAAVVKAKGGKESAQLSMAYVAATFCNSLLKAMEGKSGVVDVAYVESKVMPEVKFFSSNVELSKEGIKGFEALPAMSNYEKELLKKALPELKDSIEQGIKYAQSKKGQK